MPQEVPEGAPGHAFWEVFSLPDHKRDQYDIVSYLHMTFTCVLQGAQETSFLLDMQKHDLVSFWDDELTE